MSNDLHVNESHPNSFSFLFDILVYLRKKKIDSIILCKFHLICW